MPASCGDEPPNSTVSPPRHRAGSPSACRRTPPSSGPVLQISMPLLEGHTLSSTNGSAEAQGIPEAEKRLQGTVTKLKKTIANQRKPRSAVVRDGAAPPPSPRLAPTATCRAEQKNWAGNLTEALARRGYTGLGEDLGPLSRAPVSAAVLRACAGVPDPAVAE